MKACIGYGLSIRSEIPLPGAMAVSADEGPPAIEIVFGSVPAWTEKRALGPYRVADADRFDFTLPDLARFTCLDRRRVMVDPVAAADLAHLSAMLAATVLPALLWARGELVLHAAAAAMPGQAAAVAVAGDSGAGKSTLLKRAVDRGGQSIADDSICIRLSQGRPWISGLPGGMYVNNEVGDDRRFQPVPPNRQLRDRPLERLVVLEPGAARSRLNGMAAVEALLRHRHRPRIATLLGAEPDMLSVIAEVACSLMIVKMGTGAPAWREGETTDDHLGTTRRLDRHAGGRPLCDDQPG